MLYVLMTICGERYGVESAGVIEVVPAVNLMPATQGNAALVCGEFNYHGIRIPVVDGGVLLAGQPSRRRLSTRVLIFDIQDENERRHIGLMAEEMTETIKYVAEEYSEYRAEEKSGNTIEIAQERANMRGFRILNTRYIRRVAFYR
jgi:chemotaxis-related protein WspB